MEQPLKELSQVQNDLYERRKVKNDDDTPEVLYERRKNDDDEVKRKEEKEDEVTVAYETLEHELTVAYDTVENELVDAVLKCMRLEATIARSCQMLKTMKEKKQELKIQKLTTSSMDITGLSDYLIPISTSVAVAGAGAIYYIYKMPDPTCIPPVDLNDQSYVLEDGSRCSKLVPKGELLSCMYEDVRTMYDTFMRGLKISENGPCLGTRSGPNAEFVWLSYQEVYDQSLAFGSWMLDNGMKSKEDDIVGIFSQNRTEWVLTERACCAYTFVPVALYDTLGDQAVAFIINQTEMKIIVCDVATKANHILKMVDSGDGKKLKVIVVMNGLDDVNQDLANKLNVQVVAYNDALEKGKLSLKPVVLPSPDDLGLICYTSGTTGDPKGVMITHGTMIANVASITSNLQAFRKIDKNDVHLSYLPLAHMYERAGQQTIFSEGGQIGFFRGDVKLLLDDMQTLKPTLFFSVPRLLNRIYDKVMAGVSGSKLKSTLFNWALSSKTKDLKNFVIGKSSIWDKIVFKKVQALFGGRVDIVITGSAPLEPKVLDFFRCALGCVVLEAYGQTEAVAGVTFSVAGDYNSGMVGPPLPCCYVKLIDVPEYGYYAKNNQGEVVVKGSSVSKGYYKMPQKTAETFDSDGWLHTGDIGQWLPNGTLKIIDRQKNLFKLSQGEYVAPEKLENTYARSMYVAQAFVEGDSLQPYVMSVIVPDEEVLLGWAKQQSIEDNFTELCKSESVKDMILSDVIKTGREAGLKGFELPKDIMLLSELFSVENGLLTPTFKNKRPELRTRFKKDITELYEKHNGK
ncbi:Long-chain-fatty-acid--CoA ligase 6 [Mactra antiquata]